MSKHYSYGSGMFGCLYEYGPNFTTVKDGAIWSLVQLFSDQLEEGEETRMRYNLAHDNIHHFENPSQAGAQYCQIIEHDGELCSECGGDLGLTCDNCRDV